MNVLCEANLTTKKNINKNLMFTIYLVNFSSSVLYGKMFETNMLWNPLLKINQNVNRERESYLINIERW